MIDLKIVCENDKYMPSYANDTDACMDIKVKIKEKDNTGFKCLYGDDGEYINKKTIKPGESVILGTGIKVSIPNDYVMLIYPRSSTGIKLHCRLANSTAVIDSGYRDEIKLAITNFGECPQTIEDTQRLAQFMIIPRPKINLITCQDDEEFKNGDRGGGIGHSGKF